MRRLFSEKQIANRVSDLGDKIKNHYFGRALTVIPVLKGSFIFAADLIRAASPLEISVDFLGVSSYGAETSTSGEVRITSDLDHPIDGRHILLVEDIVDTGLTISRVMEIMKARHPASIALCSLLHKPARERVKVDIDFLGFTIADEFVVGYGLDYAQNFRHFPYIGVVEAPSEDPEV